MNNYIEFDNELLEKVSKITLTDYATYKLIDKSLVDTNIIPTLIEELIDNYNHLEEIIKDMENGRYEEDI